ncbi:MAG: gliding motility-associated C-terminal domain-containing protein, partial [Bacteroidales bacterium]
GYQYSFDGGAFGGSGTFSSLGADGYTVTVRDANGCTVDVPVTITEPATAVSGSVTGQDDVSCFGGSDGSVTVEGSGGTPGYQYSLDGGAFGGSGTFSSLGADGYTVTIRDASGCTVDVPVTITEPGELIVTISANDVSCFNFSDGEIAVAAGGGTTPYQYSIYGDDDSQYQGSGTFTGLDVGTYNVIVRDDNMCLSDETEIVITEPNQVFVGFDAPAIETCYGDPGTITLTASGGSGSFEYSISTTQDVPGAFQESEIFDNLSGDVAYYAFVRDTGTGCIVDVNAGNSITIDQPTEIEYSVTLEQDVSGCSYSTNGEIRISSPTGGSSPYSYFINGDDNMGSRIFSGLGVGEHLIEVVDNRGCRIPETVTLSGPDPIVTDNVVLTDVTGCHGNSNGEISTEASGGTGSLLYSINGVDFVTPGNFDNLPAGDHTVTVRDDNDCILTTVYTLEQPDELIVPEVQIINATCAGAGNTAIRARSSGGTAPFTITLYLGGAEQDSFTGVADDEWVEFGPLAENMDGYEVVVDDAGNCGPVSSGLLSTEGPEELAVGSVSVTGNVCHGAAEGSIEIEAGGGTTPYTYTLFDNDNNQLDDTITGGSVVFGGLPAGTYQVAVDDANGCGPVSSADIEVEEPEALVPEVPVTGNVSCFGSSDGMIEASATGGTGTVTYTLEPVGTFSTTGVFEGLDAGIYNVVITDDEGCGPAVSGDIEITEPGLLMFLLVETEDIITGSGNEYGSVLFEMGGGTEPYEYSADGGMTWQDENLFDSLAADEYDLFVRDANGCLADTVVTIDLVTGIDATFDVQMPSCHGYDDGSIEITALVGTGPYEYSIDGGDEFFQSGIFGGLAAGTYELAVRDSSGYIWSATAVVDQPAPVSAGAVVTNAWCSSNSPSGAVDLSVTGGSGSYSYSWSNGARTKDIEDVHAGEYTVTVTDENGCDTTLVLTVDYEHLLEVSLPEVVTICRGESVELTPVVQQSGSSAVYSWVASEPPVPEPVASPIVAPLMPTFYSVRVTDENNCFDDAGVTVDLHPLQGISLGNDTIIFQGSSLLLEASGGEFVNYEWAPGTGLSDLSGPSTTATVMNPTTYYVYGETAEGCIEYDSIFIDIVQPVQPVSGFTPNGDGVNDFFDIVNAGDYPGIVVEVFNRSGQRVFHSSGYSDEKRWDGTYNGRELPVGTYYFVITLNDQFGTKPVTGPVTIVR